MNSKQTILGIGALILVVMLFAWFAKPNQGGGQPTASINNQVSGTGTLIAEEAVFDFGSISMAKGNVSHNFKIKNSGSEPVTIDKIYTSCMCTTAYLTRAGSRLGPYGMPGHGIVPRIKETLAPSEEALVEVVFDPAAHGPAGVGRADRIVYLENDLGLPLELRFTVMVTP